LLERRKKHSKKNENRHYSHSKHSSRHEHHRRDDDDDEKESRLAKHKVSSKKKRKHRRHEEEVVNPTGDYVVSLGPVVNVAPTTLLDPDVDYFTYHSHLRLFLFRRREGTYFEDLTSEVARQDFQRFVNEYNAGRLEQAYSIL